MALLAAAGGSVVVPRPGFCFCPTDQELVAGFLAHKVHGHSDYLGADWACCDPIIPTVDLYGKDDDEAYPWRVCQRLACPHSTGSTEFYCFTPRRKKHGDKPDRTVGASGTWHSNGREDDANKIYDIGGVLVGHQVYLTFKILPPQAATAAGAGSGQSKITTKKKKSTDEMENTHWVMHEYRLEAPGFQDMVLCRVRNQKKEREQQKGRWRTPWWEQPQQEVLPVVVGGGSS